MTKKILILLVLLTVLQQMVQGYEVGEGPCFNDADCGPGLVCIGSICQSPTTPPSPIPERHSYGKGPCFSDNDCVYPLECDVSSGKCTQPQSLICERIPQTWVFVYTPSGYSQQKNITQMISALEEGNKTKGSAVASTSGIYKAGWFSDWKTTSMIGVMIAILLISLAAIAGYAFNLNEIKAFVSIELGQALISVLLVSGIIGGIVFIDEIANVIVSTADLPVVCTPDEPCYITVAKRYLDDIYSIGSKYAADALKRSINEQKIASFGINTVSNWATLLYAGTSIRPNAGRTIEAERAGAIFETTSKLLVSIYAQRYFIDVIAFALAPILLLLGVLLRTFFFTRKLGGLLLAIGIAIFVIYPLTYAFAWYTLNITVYGERVGAEEEGSCPVECKLKPPVAFYINNTTGGIIQFESKLDLRRAGINRLNWKSGDVNGDGNPEFPGLVACTNLSEISTEIEDSCKDCPTECREVPLPRHRGECNSEACVKCNPGCKIMRLRTDCAQKCSLSGCPSVCRAQLPFENKCYIASNGTKVAANFSVDCTKCINCPNWCLLKKLNPDGSIELVRRNEPLCKNNVDCEQCPTQCAYLTKVGESYDCEDAKVCGRCPKPCRIDADFQLSSYDTENLIPRYCKANQQIAEACQRCPSLCKIQIPQDPLNEENPSCYPYPQKNYRPQNCTSCPKYCRFSSYQFISKYSAVVKEITGVPSDCKGADIFCDSSACPSDCRASQTPPTCREFNEYDEDNFNLCRKCPPEGRIILRHTNAAGQQDYFGPPAINTQFYGSDYSTIKCDEENCSSSCKRLLEVPSGPGCMDFDPSAGTSSNCTKCPIECRVIFSNQGMLSNNCDNYACGEQDCPSNCKVHVSSNQGYVCSEYFGNGRRGDYVSYSFGCYNVTNPSTSQGCIDKTSEETCELLREQGCKWLRNDDITIPIGQRNPPYNQFDSCKQCPEHYRIKGFDFRNLQIDCSLSSCPDECRIEIPKKNGGHQECREYISSSLPYFGCPMLCRRIKSDMPPSPYCNNPTCLPPIEKTDLNNCTFDPAPQRVCEGCFDCPYDCLFEPPVRTDCAELCSKEEMVEQRLSPGEFVSSFPGAASGAVDVRNVGVLMMPALVLPLFSIVIVISFVRVLSSILGGDIDIPGLSRII
ncbi:MAG: hypothetical protein N3G80_02745 [Candidatus Micrarchaeota archaeon]|nr:hypothetical protein [Candidatus Micrarchaeota archaeon]